MSRNLPPRTLKQREARLWNYFNKQDIFFPIRDWPWYQADNILSEHKDNRQRYNLFFFLVGNGLRVSIASEWTLCADVINGNLVTGVYDTTALLQVGRQMPEQVAKGQMFKGTKSMMDMTLGRVVKM